jgi:hypothetical protein
MRDVQLPASRWFDQYANAYGPFGIGLALTAGVAIVASFWIWIAAFMGTYWERMAGTAVVARMEEMSAERVQSAGNSHAQATEEAT